MEHIRWCRYHYYNGWKYAPAKEVPVKGDPVKKVLKKKDPINRTHSLLVDFDDLSPEDKKKDSIFSDTIRKILDTEAERIYGDSAKTVK